MTTAEHPLPAALRRAAARHLVRTSLHRPPAALRALLRWVAPGAWQPDPALRRAVLDAAVLRGDRAAAELRLLEPGDAPGTPGASRRAAALELLAAGMGERDRARELAVVDVLRTPRPTRATAGRGPAGTAAEALAGAERLRTRDGVAPGPGDPRPAASDDRVPRIVITLPALEGNPYTGLMERGFARHGLAAVHVDDLDDAAAVVDARAVGRFEAVLLVNASNRLVWSAPGRAAADQAARRALERIDGWRAAGVGLVATIHDRSILGPEHRTAERALAQGIADRADVVHVLTASTPRVLDDWLTLDPAHTVHLPHPNYDGVHEPPPDRATARAALGLPTDDPADPGARGATVLVGLVGLLSRRKGCGRLLDALDRVPDPLPDGRRLRLLVAGRLVDADAEELVRRMHDDPRVLPLPGTIPDERIPGILAALDAAVVPYDAYLNSGWTILALTAGVPVIAPSGGTAEEVVLPAALRTWDPARQDSLAGALAAAGSLATPEARAAARASVAAADPDRVADAFARLLRGVPALRPS